MTVNPVDSDIYGDLFTSGEMRALFADDVRLQSMLDVEAALARAQAGLGLIPKAAAREITAKAKIDVLDLTGLARRTQLAGAPVSGLAAALSKACKGEAGRYVHWGATTQDIADTGLILQMRDGFGLIRAELAAAIMALVKLVHEHRDSVMIGRTYLQHALPITFGYKCAVWLAGLLDAHGALVDAGAHVLKLQFSGAVGTLASLGERGLEVAQALGRELDLEVPDIGWHVRRMGLAGTAGALSALCASLGKIAGDICLMSQTEIGEVSEPHMPGRGASSTMPHKRNPVASMLILAIARNVQALAGVMHSSMIADHERPVDSWQAEWLALPQMFALTSGALRHAVFVLEGLRVEPARMRANLDATNGLIMAEAVAMAASPKLGHGRAHDLLEQACALALEDGLGLRQVLIENAAIMGALEGRDIDDLLDPARYTGSAGVMTDNVLTRARVLLKDHNL